jgi:hypothetical protein
MTANVNTLTVGPWTIEVCREMHEVYSNSPTPAKDWRFIDAAGHGHFWQDGYPTLRWASVPCTMGHGDDCDAEGWWECRLCAEHISPGMKPPSMFPKMIAGLTTASLFYDDGERRDEYAITDPTTHEPSWPTRCRPSPGSRPG